MLSNTTISNVPEKIMDRHYYSLNRKQSVITPKSTLLEVKISETVQRHFFEYHLLNSNQLG